MLRERDSVLICFHVANCTRHCVYGARAPHLHPSLPLSLALTLASVYISYARFSVSSIVLCYYDSPANAVYHTKQIIFLIFSANLANFSLLHAHSFSLSLFLSFFFSLPLSRCRITFLYCVSSFCRFYVHLFCIQYSRQIKRLAIILGTIYTFYAAASFCVCVCVCIPLY